MADIAELGVKVTSDGIEKTDKEIKQLGKSSDKTERSSEKLGRTSKRTGGAIAELGAKAKVTYALIGVAVVSALSKSISLHSQFASKISELSAITGATGKDLKFYADQAKLIGETTTLSATQAAEAFKLIASAKPDLLDNASALAEVTKEAVALAEAAGLDLPTAADALGSALNQFSAGADEASRFINVLAAGSKFGSSAINDVAMSLKAAGTVASNAGISFEETTAAIEILGKVAIKGSEAGTDLRNIILRLSTQSRDEFNPEIVGLSKALQNLSDANLTTAESAKLFGVRSIAAANALIKESSELGTLTDKLTGTNTAYEQASIRTDNLEGDVKQMGSAWESVGIELGGVFNPILRMTTGLLTGVAKVAKTAVFILGGVGEQLGAYAAMAASVLALDFDQASRINELRKEELKATQDKISELWNQVDAQDALNESEQDGLDNKDSGGGVAGGIMSLKGTTIKGDATEELAEDKLDKLTEQFATEQELEISAYRETLALLKEIKLESEEDDLSLDAEISAIKLKAKEDHEKKMLNIHKKGLTERQKWEAKSDRIKASTAIGNAASLAGALAGMSDKHNKRLLQVQRALSLVQIAMNLPPAIMKAYASLGPIGGTVAAVGLVATAVAQVSAVNDAASGGGGGGSISAPPSVATSPDTLGVDPGGQPFQDQAQAAPQFNITINGIVDGDNVEEMIANAIKRGMDSDYINLTVQGQPVEAQVA